jgi:hypothetical protein
LALLETCDKMRILADVAPYSCEYQKFSQTVRSQTQGDPDLKAEYERIAEQVRQTKASTLQVAQKHFNAPTDRIEGTVKSASAKGIELAEYPGRIFHLSSVGSSMADMTAEMLVKWASQSKLFAEIRSPTKIDACNTRAVLKQMPIKDADHDCQPPPRAL